MKANTRLELMCSSYQSGTFLVDEIEIHALLLRNKIADIQDEFTREMNHFVYEEARHCCEGCEMDYLSQIH